MREETGLLVHDWSDVIYEIEVAAPDLGWRLRVEAFRAVDWSGELVVDDPDGIVVDARFVAVEPAGATSTVATRGWGSPGGVAGRAVGGAPVLRL